MDPERLSDWVTIHKSVEQRVGLAAAHGGDDGSGDAGARPHLQGPLDARSRRSLRTRRSGRVAAPRTPTRVIRYELCRATKRVGPNSSTPTSSTLPVDAGQRRRPHDRRRHFRARGAQFTVAVEGAARGEGLNPGSAGRRRCVSCVYRIRLSLTAEVAPMADFVDSTVKDIDSRLSELKSGGDKARGRLVRRSSVGAADRVARPPATAPAAPTPSPRRARAGRPRGRRGGNTRANQALELVRESPGITIPQIAEQLEDRAELPVPGHAQAGRGRPGQARRPGLAPRRVAERPRVRLRTDTEPPRSRDRGGTVSFRQRDAGRRDAGRIGLDQAELLDGVALVVELLHRGVDARTGRSRRSRGPGRSCTRRPSRCTGSRRRSPPRRRRSRPRGSPSRPNRPPGCRAPSRGRGRWRRWRPTPRWRRHGPR